ncbi:MAG: Ig-like domain-containing protein [Rhizobacter sp.]|nr:Ig-like domain-containing protein [Rhizobacter sp.]
MSFLQRWHLSTLALLASVLLAACGGGIYLEFDDYDDLPPVVELAASSLSAFAGDSVRLVAAAADENGIDHVSFYRYDGNTAVRLGTDGSSPYDWQLLVPADGRTSVIVFAHAVDNAGNATDSNLVTISIAP